MPDHCCNAGACLAALMPHDVRTRFAGAAMQRPSWTNNAQQIFLRQALPGITFDGLLTDG
jgi:hypothetical protein